MNTTDIRTMADLICANDSPSIGPGTAAKALNKAADTIDFLRAALQVSEDELRRVPRITEAAIELEAYLWANVPDLIDISTHSELAGEGVRKRLQALRAAIRDA